MLPPVTTPPCSELEAEAFDPSREEQVVALQFTSDASRVVALRDEGADLDSPLNVSVDSFDHHDGGARFEPPKPNHRVDVKYGARVRETIGVLRGVGFDVGRLYDATVQGAVSPVAVEAALEAMLGLLRDVTGKNFAAMKGYRYANMYIMQVTLKRWKEGWGGVG